MRDFIDKDRTKKPKRIQPGENPANLPADTLALLEAPVKAALTDGYLPCPVGKRPWLQDPRLSARLFLRKR